MAKVIVWILFFRFFSAGNAPAESARDFAMENTDSQLVEMTITGETNINRFNFYLNNPQKKNSLSHVPGEMKAHSLIFNIPVNLLECKNKLMLQDFRKMLNAAEYPVATIGIDAPEFEEILTGSDLHSIPMRVTLSGITQKLHSSYSVHAISPELQILTGDVTIRLSDFAMKPPQKMMGLIKLSDEIIINFKISIKTA